MPYSRFVIFLRRLLYLATHVLMEQQYLETTQKQNVIMPLQVHRLVALHLGGERWRATCSCP